jgi:hypothetical protein
MTTAAQTITGIMQAHTHYALANRADVSTPDSETSAGSSFLGRVRDALVETVEYAAQDDESVADVVAKVRDDAHEIADGAVPIYTHDRMTTLVDLAAYDENLSEYAQDVDMVSLAGVALYLVAERLVNALLDEAEEEDE